MGFDSAPAKIRDPRSRGKRRYYYGHVGDLRDRLRGAVAREEIRLLHTITPWRHFFVAGRQLLLYLGLAAILFFYSSPWIWIPAAILQGFVILGFIILLHDQVHSLIFRRPHRRLQRLLGLLYALPSAISATQFDIWHNDHHRELGSSETDPKRAHLSPKKNSRFLKFLYFTPWLFVIYARAAAREAGTYPAALQRRVRLERFANMAIHLAAAVTLGIVGWDVLLRVYVVPLFICFPPAFFLNRLGQHYDIDPEDVAHWSTLVDGNPIWRFLFLNSNHHIEHHYYPAVPLYSLPRLNRALQPFFRDNGIENRSYRRLLVGWLWKNKKPHSNWDLDLV